jgi:hypothetical protein
MLDQIWGDALEIKDREIKKVISIKKNDGKNDI